MGSTTNSSKQYVASDTPSKTSGSLFSLPFRSLGWRIALWYATLLVIAFVVFAVAVTVAFRQVLLEQAQQRIWSIAEDMQRVAARNDPFFVLGEAIPIELELANPGNLNHWASPTIYIQVDRLDGYPLGKSQNMGSVQFPADRNLTLEHSFEFEHGPSDLGEMLVLNRLIVINDHPVVLVHVGETLNLFNVTLSRIERIVAAILAFAIVAVVAASIVLARRAVNPINELTKAMREISSEGLDRRLHWVGRDDEVGRLSNTFDEMLERLERAFSRERQFIADASHELKTPLTVINAHAQMLRRWADSDEAVRKESLEAIASESAYLAKMINGMLTLAKADSAEAIPKEPLHLDPIIAEVLSSAAPRAAQKGLKLVAPDDRGASDVVMADANLLRQLFGNLIENAIKFTEQGQVRVARRQKDGRVVIEISDSGIGIEPEARGHIFERFFRADKSRSRQIEGTGLGLAIAASIVRVHDGSIDVGDAPGGGTTFTVRLPLVQGSDQPSA